MSHNTSPMSNGQRLPALHDNTVGVIDIGSNSVRLVVYHGLTRVPLPLYNEKHFCALGKGLSQTGRLNPQGVEKAYASLGRFLLMAERLELTSLAIVATAAVRDAEDGEAFVAEIKRRFNVDVRVISGELEAEYAALGVVASIHQPHGVIADMGGGSMELGYIEHGELKERVTTRLGALRLADEVDGQWERIPEVMERELRHVDWLDEKHVPTFYGVGGSFRTIAKLHMKKSGYPLPILHEYTLSRSTISAVVNRLAPMSVDAIADLPGVPRKRASSMVPAAKALEYLLEHSGCEDVLFSVSGIREGYLYSTLDDVTRQQDALIASALELASFSGRGDHYAREVFEWLNPIFVHDDNQRNRLRRTACLLGEVAWPIDPNFRGEWAFNRVLQSSLKGANHKERIMLALALYHRYHSKWKHESGVLSLLDEHERLWAKAVGTALNLAFQLSGGLAGNLNHASLRLQDDQVELLLEPVAQPLRNDTVEKRLEGLGSTFKALSNFFI